MEFFILNQISNINSRLHNQSLFFSRYVLCSVFVLFQTLCLFHISNKPTIDWYYSWIVCERKTFNRLEWAKRKMARSAKRACINRKQIEIRLRVYCVHICVLCAVELIRYSFTCFAVTLIIHVCMRVNVFDTLNCISRSNILRCTSLILILVKTWIFRSKSSLF